jgi:hypothetical protein
MIEELNDIFMEVKDAEPEFENIPDGEYLAIVTKAEYKLSKAEKPMVQFSFKVTEGEYKDKYHNKFMMLAGKDETSLRGNLSRYGTELKKYGLEVTSIQESFEALTQTIGRDVKITLKTSDSGFTNTSVEVL